MPEASCLCVPTCWRCRSGPSPSMVGPVGSSPPPHHPHPHHPLRQGDYVIVFTSRGQAKLPSMWIMGAWRSLPRPFRKHVQYIVLVRPSGEHHAVHAAPCMLCRVRCVRMLCCLGCGLLGRAGHCASATPRKCHPCIVLHGAQQCA